MLISSFPFQLILVCSISLAICSHYLEIFLWSFHYDDLHFRNTSSTSEFHLTKVPRMSLLEYLHESCATLVLACEPFNIVTSLHNKKSIVSLMTQLLSFFLKKIYVIRRLWKFHAFPIKIKYIKGVEGLTRELLSTF